MGNMYGEYVTLLHDELKTLGFSIPDKEIFYGVFGQGTEQAVKEFQEKHGLQMSGVVDQEMAIRINREVQGTGPDSAKSFVVKGLVVYADGKALADGLVRAFDKDLRSEELLGETTTDEEGRYAIHYNEEQFSRAELGSADLKVRTYNPDGLELHFHRTGCQAGDMLHYQDRGKIIDIVTLAEFNYDKITPHNI